MKELQPGLDDEELTKRVAEDPPEPWRPNFLKSVGDPSNDFWVNKILNTALNDKKVSALNFLNPETVDLPLAEDSRQGGRRYHPPGVLDMGVPQRRHIEADVE